MWRLVTQTTMNSPFSNIQNKYTLFAPDNNALVELRASEYGKLYFERGSRKTDARINGVSNTVSGGGRVT